MSNYLDLYLEKTFPADSLQEAVSNKKATSMLGEMRKMLGVDMALAKGEIKDAIMDGKVQIDEAHKQLADVAGRNDELENALRSVKSALVLDRLSTNLPEVKKNYAKKVLSGKDEQFIMENFDYTIDLFDKETDPIQFCNLLQFQILPAFHLK
jgi:hypothetical protein